MVVDRSFVSAAERQLADRRVRRISPQALAGGDEFAHESCDWGSGKDGFIRAIRDSWAIRSCLGDVRGRFHNVRFFAGFSTVCSPRVAPFFQDMGPNIGHFAEMNMMLADIAAEMAARLRAAGGSNTEVRPGE